MSEPRSSVSTSDEQKRLDRVSSSMLWSAWADAIGFISELTDARGLKRRTQGRDLSGTMPWTRRIGGRFGVPVQLPAGTYSDDTQLRLASSRAISGHGFDVEAFARIELPLWPAYALGGGNSSKAAASGMSRVSANWFANAYSGWTQAGGNGVAMRIQPHVWAAESLGGRSYLVDVVRNAATTHGHPRAIVGATLQAAALGHTLRTGSTPAPNEWLDLLGEAASGLQVMRGDAEIGSYWLPRWEAEEHRSFDEAWWETVEEISLLLDIARRVGPVFDPASYERLVEEFQLRDPERRGSGSATSVAAVALAASFDGDPRAAGIVASNAVGTDTDTIATMACSVIAAAAHFEVDDELQDRRYLLHEAQRLTRIGLGLSAPQFPYPDLLRWAPPQSQQDAVGLADGRPALAGLGWLEWVSPSWENKEALWTWATTSFGPSVLVKHRAELRELQPGNYPMTTRLGTSSTRREVSGRDSLPQPRLFDDLASPPSPPTEASESFDLGRWFETTDPGALTDAEVGRAVRLLIQQGRRDELSQLADALWESVRSRGARH